MAAIVGAPSSAELGMLRSREDPGSSATRGKNRLSRDKRCEVAPLHCRIQTLRVSPYGFPSRTGILTLHKSIFPAGTR